MNQKIANNMYKFTLYNIYTLIREKNTNIKVVVRKIAWPICCLPAKPVIHECIKGALYRIQILCRRYTFWSYPAGLTIADPPG